MIKLKELKLPIKKIVPKKINKKKLIFIILLSIFILLLGTSIYLSASILNHDSVYSGIYLDGVDLSNMNKNQLNLYLSNKYSNMDFDIILAYGTYSKPVSSKELNLNVDIEDNFNKVFNSGREGNIFRRLKNIFIYNKKHLYLNTLVEYDETSIDTVINQICNDINITSKEHKLFVNDKEAYINVGLEGKTVENGILKSLILEQLHNLNSGTISIPVKTIKLQPINVNNFYNLIIVEAKDSNIEILENKKINITPHITGRQIEKASLETVCMEIEKNYYKPFTNVPLPIYFVEPEKTKQYVEELLFRDVLSSYSLSYKTVTEKDLYTADILLSLATSINGKILAPGEEFSFNSFTYDYWNQKNLPINQLEICASKVASTLYNTALEANFKIIERTNLNTIPSFIRPGRESYVSKDGPNLRFVNSTEYPVRIDFIMNTEKISCRIIGTDMYPNLEIKIITNELSSTKHDTSYIKDSALSEGEKLVETQGKDGLLVETIRMVMKNNEELSENKIDLSSYAPIDEVIRVSE